MPRRYWKTASPEAIAAHFAPVDDPGNVPYAPEAIAEWLRGPAVPEGLALAAEALAREIMLQGPVLWNVRLNRLLGLEP